MIQERLHEWIAHSELLNRETLVELRLLLERYPYFQTARLLYLKNLFVLHDISFGEELRKAALYVVDRRMLFHLIEGHRFAVPSRQRLSNGEGVAGLDRTLSLIDAFLSSSPDEESDPKGVVPVDVTTDYTSYLLREEKSDSSVTEIPRMKGQSLIDEFIEKSADESLLPAAADVKDADPPALEDLAEETSKEVEEDTEDESYLTETLAKIYIKQRRYSKALEIIKKLNLKYPKKNAYFADQIRFLEKLIINTKSK